MGKTLTNRRYYEQKIIQFPRNTLPKEKARLYLNTAFNNNVNYSKHSILGYPGTIPLAASIEALIKFLALNANNIGTHTRIESEAGFKGTQGLERQCIAMVGHLFRADNFANKIDGYLNSGGTEGNIMGLWILRNYFRKLYSATPVCFKTALTHYSIQKAMNLLYLDKVQVLKSNSLFEIDLGDLEARVRELFARGVRYFVVIATLGYTVTGSIDRIESINRLINRLNRELGVIIKIHLDAAHGGFIYPFLTKNRYGFNLRHVYTMSLDAHKLGLVPYSCGIFLCRKHLQRFIETNVDYIKSHFDDTLCGSRSGAIAASLWAAITSLGMVGYRRIYNKCLASKLYLIKELKRKNINCWYYTNDSMNIICVEFNGLRDNRLSEKIEQKYGLNLAQVPFSESTRNVYKIVLMPHVKGTTIDEFVRDVCSEHREIGRTNPSFG